MGADKENVMSKLVDNVLNVLTDHLEPEAKRRKEVRTFIYGGPEQPDLVDPILFDIEGETYRRQAVKRLMEKSATRRDRK